MARRGAPGGGASPSFKVVLLGEGRVGKTSLVVRYVRQLFNDKQQPTIQASFLSKRLTVDGAPCTLNIWDTAGQERFHALGPIYYRDADAALLVYDVTDTDSLKRVKAWVTELKRFAGQDIVLAIAGNKVDLERERSVREADAVAYAKEIGAAHFGTSAKLNRGVDGAFLDITRKLLAREERRRASAGAGGAVAAATRRPTITVQDAPAPKASKSSCC